MMIRDEIERFPSGAMIRAARALVGMEAIQLAQAVGVSRKTLHEIEREANPPTHDRRTDTVRRIRDLFAKKYGVLFLFDEEDAGEGVRLSRPADSSSA